MDIFLIANQVNEMVDCERLRKYVSDHIKKIIKFSSQILNGTKTKT